MNLKTKLAKKALSWLISIIMIVPTISFNLSFSTFATQQQEVDFCLDKMKNIPTDDEFLKEMQKLPKEEDLRQSRHVDIFHADGSKNSVDLDERLIYKKIQKIVDDLKESIKIILSGENISDITTKFKPDIQRAISCVKNEKDSIFATKNSPEKICLVDAIYHWVAENILYDCESYDATVNFGKTLIKRKPQDAYFVFSEKIGVCEGYARLLNLMMKMAGIPCMYVRSICGFNSDYGHAFNAVFVEDSIKNKCGWVLLDPTWASPNGSDGDESVTIFLSGSICFDQDCFYKIIPKNENYSKNLYDELKINDEQTINPSEEFIENLNQKTPKILNELKTKYKNSPHFEKLEFFNQNNCLYIKYKTNLSMSQAKKINEENLNYIDINDINYYINELNGENMCVFANLSNKPPAELKKDDVNFFELSIAELIKNMNNSDNQEILDSYVSELNKMCSDFILNNLKNIENNTKKLNEKINDELSEINSQNIYKNLFKLKKIKIRIQNEGGVNYLYIDGDKGFSEEEITKQYKTCHSKIIAKRQEQENKSKFIKFFFFFHNKTCSIEQSNQILLSFESHKIFEFEVPPASHMRVNWPSLSAKSHENEAYLDFHVNSKEQEHFLKALKISDKNIAGEDGFAANFNSCGLAIMIPSNTQNLTIEGDIAVKLDEAVNLKHIDTTKSVKYHAENEILYEKISETLSQKANL